MAWLFPAAFLGLIAVAGPVLVHLLQRRRARRAVFPSVRFVAAADESSANFKRISDPMLLLIRAAIVASAALALAQPLLLTEGRSAEWSSRIARVVIVDTSESARGAITSEAIAAETSSADYVTTIEASSPGPAVKRASGWLTDAPFARREIVILSDFQRGTVTADDVGQVPAEIGLRFLPAESVRQPSEAPWIHVLSADGVLSADVRLNGPETSITYSPQNAASAGLQISAAPSGAAAVSSLLRVVARAGAAAPDAGQPIVIRFPGAPPGPSGGPVSGDWTFGAAQRLLRATRDVKAPISVASSGGALVVDVDADPGSLGAAQVVQAALDARLDPAALAERETERIPDRALAAWSREPAPPDPAQWKNTDESDGRWLWALALVLLGVETMLRHSSPERTKRVEARAA